MFEQKTRNQKYQFLSEPVFEPPITIFSVFPIFIDSPVDFREKLAK